MFNKVIGCSRCSMQLRGIYRRRNFGHVSRLLKELHWLRVPEYITFQLAVLAYRCQHNMAPRYLTIQLHQASGVYHRRRQCSLLSYWTFFDAV